MIYKILIIIEHIIIHVFTYLHYIFFIFFVDYHAHTSIIESISQSLDLINLKVMTSAILVGDNCPRLFYDNCFIVINTLFVCIQFPSCRNLINHNHPKTSSYCHNNKNTIFCKFPIIYVFPPI